MNDEKKFELSYHSYGHPGVYLLAKRTENEKINMVFKFEYTQNMGLSLGAIIALIIFMPLIFAGIVIATLYYVHTRGYAEVRVPKLCRCLWCKHYLSPEEIEEMKRLEELRQRIKTKEELNRRLAAKPTIRGFEIEDSFF